MSDSLGAVHDDVIACTRCPRLVAWRQQAAVEAPARFRGQEYWARPLPGFGDPAAQLVVAGLAPAAHGGNRTGRVFTGDRSGDWLYRALHRAGLANRPESVARDDGLRLRGVYVLAIVRCAPPANRPEPAERDACLEYTVRELRLLRRARVALALGSFAWDGVLRALAETGATRRLKPKFGHGAVAEVGEWRLVGSYHPSQQNTFTGRLTEAMLDEVVGIAAGLAGITQGLPSARPRTR